jgi:hypothetical protein
VAGFAVDNRPICSMSPEKTQTVPFILVASDGACMLLRWGVLSLILTMSEQREDAYGQAVIKISHDSCLVVGR